MQTHTDVSENTMESASHLVIFTPLALNIANGFPSSQNDVCELFAQNLASRTQTKLQLSSIATKAVGGKDLMATFENFQRALEVADCAIIVVPGRQINLLDAIYPRLLVFMTLNTEWFNRILLICLGDLVEDKGKFDTTIFKHDPVIFSASSSDWTTESEKWEDVLQFIRHPSPGVTEEKPFDHTATTKSQASEASSEGANANHVDKTANSTTPDANSSPEDAEDKSFDMALTPTPSDRSYEDANEKSFDGSANSTSQDKEELFDEAASLTSQDVTVLGPDGRDEEELIKNDPLSNPANGLSDSGGNHPHAPEVDVTENTASGQNESSNGWCEDPDWSYVEPIELKESTGGWGKLKYLGVGILVIGIGTGVFLKAKQRI